MSKSTTAYQGNTSLTTALKLATDAATAAVTPTDHNKSGTFTATLTGAVTENGKTKNTGVNASVTLGITDSEEDAPAAKK